MTYSEITPSYPGASTSGIQRIEDSAFIPEDERNKDWRDYLEWIAAGNTPEPWVAEEQGEEQ